ncbi:hypothetical protein [Rubrobacter calidifluminis]|uniref:hypothetical protein n=1 Tax=Rubrobacter calidifluminis TaxID=1392640 RepID=UPI00235E4009|nr:hypothetical protein [Rubrobacter calidifluminis]
MVVAGVYFLLMWGFLTGAVAILGAFAVRAFGVEGVEVPVLLASALIAFFLSAALLRFLRRRA